VINKGLVWDGYLCGVNLVDRMGHGKGYPRVFQVNVDLALR
jgi:hypothetical protein